MSTPFTIIEPQGPLQPIVISVPHCGTEIPAALASGMDAALVQTVPDTDWFVDELYGFAPALGITLIRARYSRYVIDLNRDPTGKPLYQDQRQQSALVPVRSFGDQPLYTGDEPDAAEVQRRYDTYYAPYHAKVAERLAALRQQFRHVLFFDAHSIKRLVPSIQPAPFPDLILGDQQGQTAAAQLSATALAVLGHGGTYQVSHNVPFMGGYLTRHFGQPQQGVHALQLEMAQDVYMDEARAARDAIRQGAIQPVLREMLLRLAANLRAMA